MTVVGIDPGVKGGLVVLAPDRVEGRLMPLANKREIDARAVMAWLFAQEPDLVVLERVGPRNLHDSAGRQIRKAGNEFRFATGYGVLQGVLASLALRYRLVSPQRWQQRVLGDLPGNKAAAIAHVQTHLPDLDLTPGRCRVPQDGLADAACLAVYGRDYVLRNT